MPQILDDDDDDFQNLANVKELGNIKFCRCKRSKAKVIPSKPKGLDEELKVHERAKKGMVQRVKYINSISSNVDILKLHS